MRKSKTAAVITIKDIQKMTPAGRRMIYNWLVKQAKFLLTNHKELAPNFRARYIY